MNLHTDDEVRAAFWAGYQPGFRFSRYPRGSRAFFEEVERHRYALEPHIPEVVRFEDYAGRDVLEVGCGIATDGLQFARGGCKYVGLDESLTALDLAERRFALESVEGRFVAGQATSLPFADRSFDLVYSHGVIHHLDHTQLAVDEFRRVLRPGGVALVMVYHRVSLNYIFTIMVLRRLMAAALLVPGVASYVAHILREDPVVLHGHRALLEEHGWRYLADVGTFLSNNTDGPGNPLSKVYSRNQAKQLFNAWRDVSTTVRFLNLRIFPMGERLAQTAVARDLSRRIGWHLYVRATR